MTQKIIRDWLKRFKSRKSVKNDLRQIPVEKFAQKYKVRPHFAIFQFFDKK